MAYPFLLHIVMLMIKGCFVWYALHKKCIYVFCYLNEGLSFVKKLAFDSLRNN